MEEYKGIYYGDDTEQKFYEGGAHFKYSKLYKLLEILVEERKEKEKENKPELLYVHKNKNLNNSKNTKINKKTRNILNDLDINKLQYNTINNNYNNINYNIKNNFNIFLSINKDNNKNRNENKSLNNNKKEIDNNISLNNNKNEIYSRNKDLIKPYRGRPNTLFKDGFQKMLYSKKKKLLSLSMEQKSNHKKYPINLKRSLPELNHDGFKIINDNKTNDSSNNNNNNKIKVYKKNDIKNFKNRNPINKDIHHNISYSNANKITMKTERNQPLLEKKSEKKIEGNYIQTNFQNKKSEKLFNKLNHTNSIKFSKRIHNIIKKRIIGTKDINVKQKTIINSNVFKKTKIDKEKINIFVNKSNKKNNINNNNILLEEGNIKNNQFNSITKETNNQNSQNLDKTGKKFVNLKKIDKYHFTKLNNNQLLFNKYIGKSRNYIGENSSLNIKKTFNNNINSKNNNNDTFNNHFKTIGDMNKTFDNKINKNLTLNKSIGKNTKNKQFNKLNLIYRPTHKKTNNLNESKRPYVIKPYIQIKQNNNKIINIKNKINLNNSIRVNKKMNNNFFNINVNESE